MQKLVVLEIAVFGVTVYFNKYINFTFTLKCIFETFVGTPLLVVIYLQVSAYKAERTKEK
jgi:hypothetical protein